MIENIEQDFHAKIPLIEKSTISENLNKDEINKTIDGTIRKKEKEKIPFENKYKNYQTYEVTFTTKKKYNPITRSVKVKAKDRTLALQLIARRFGSLKKMILLNTYVPTEKHIIINKIKEI